MKFKTGIFLLASGCVWGIFLFGSPSFAKVGHQLQTLSSQGVKSNEGLYNSELSAVSSNGRFVTFRSRATNLVSPSANGNLHIFLRDNELGTTELISQSTAGVQGNNSSEVSDVSDDGCRVVFESYASNLVAADTNGTYDVFLRDRCNGNGITIRISTLANGSQTVNGNASPDITPNGRYVAYQNGDLGVVRYDVETGTTLPLTGDIKTGNNPSISDDGSRIAFHSYPALIGSDTNGVWDIYLWTAPNSLSLASTSSNGSLRQQGNESASRIVEPAISGNGRYISFATTASNLVAGDTGDFQDVFVKDTQTGALIRASVTADGVQGNGDSPKEQGGRAPLSKNGAWIAFESSATNLVSNTGGTGTVLRNLVTGETLSLDTGFYSSGIRPALSDDLYGRFTTFFSANQLDSGYASSGVFRYDRHPLPVADAGPDQSGIGVSQQVTLDGSGSQDVGNGFFLPEPNPGLTYTWSQLEGPAAVALSDAHAVKPTFTPAQNGRYRFKLVVNDTLEDSLPDEVVIDVGSGNGNLAPTANAGNDQRASINTTVTLDGSGSSDPENGPLTYQWSQLFGPEAVTFDNSAAENPSFVPSQAGTYIFQLVVNDGAQSSDPSFVSIEVVDSNERPVADAGADQSVAAGDTVSLDGSGSTDPENASLTYQWSQLFGPEAVTLTSSAVEQPSFVPSQPGTYIFQLIVDDGTQSSEPSFVSVLVDTGGTAAYSVNVGENRSLNVGSKLTLKAALTDPVTGKAYKKKTKYLWEQVSGPQAKIVGKRTAANFSFIPPFKGTYQFSVTVYDTAGQVAKDDITVTVDSEITVQSPAAGDTLALDFPFFLEWTASGINPKSKLGVIVSPDAGDNWYFVKWVKAGLGFTSITFKTSKGYFPSDQYYIAVCLPETKNNDLICGISEGSFTLE